LPPVRQAAQWTECLARAIDAAHQRGIIHRDLKPGNILLQETENVVPKITDFGLAKSYATGILSAAALTQSGDILGTPEYMAPEQAAGRTREAGPAADIYALGAILYEMLTGRPPLEGPSALDTLQLIVSEQPLPPRRLQPHVPRDLETICLACLEKNPSRRYASAAALGDDLRAFLAGEPIRARPPGVAERLARAIRKRPFLSALVGLACVAVPGLAVGASWSSGLAIAFVAVASLLLASAWYGARLRAALREADQQHLQSQRNVERLHLLLETTQRLLRSRSLDELLAILGETTATMANAERATIYLVDEERRELWSKVALGDDVGEIRMSLGEGIAGTVATTGTAINLADPYRDARFNPDVDRRTGYTTRNLLTVAIKARAGRILGVFQVVNKRGGPFNAEDADILHALAESAALALEKARSEEAP
jgi:serine/threonine-protein kinase